MKLLTMIHAGGHGLSHHRILGLLTALVLAAVTFTLVFGGYGPSLHTIKAAVAPWLAFVHHRPVTAAALFFMANLVITTLCIPIEVVFGLAGGALFGLVEGSLLVSLASSLGALFAFWGSRFLLQGFVEQRFAHQIAKVDAGLQKDGVYFLLSVRLMPFLPYSLTNIALGLTTVRSRDFYVYSQLGMIPATVIYVNAGTRLAHLRSLGDIMSPSLLIAFVLLALMPWIAKAVLGLWQGHVRHA